MSLASRMISVAQNLLIKYGEPVSASRDLGTFVPSTGAMGSTSTMTYDGVGYPSNYNRRDIDNDVIRQDDILLIFQSTSVPQVNDTFSVGGKLLTALSIQLVTVSGQAIIYKIQLRQ